MDEFMATEVTSRWIYGPFMVPQVHTIFGSHFCTVPLGLIEKLGSTALWLIHHHSKEDHLSESTNGWINTSVNAMKYFSATDMADFVCLIFVLYSFFIIPHLISICFKNPHIAYMAVNLNIQYSFFFVYAIEAQGIVSCKLASWAPWSAMTTSEVPAQPRGFDCSEYIIWTMLSVKWPVTPDHVIHVHACHQYLSACLDIMSAYCISPLLLAHKAYVASM